MEDAPRANVLPGIESRFAFLIDGYGFALAQSTEIPSSAWYRSGSRSVVVAYDFMREAAVDVTLEDATTGERHALHDLLAFESPDVRRLEGVRAPALVASELARMAGLLDSYGTEFLRGDVARFRVRFREALLVTGLRARAERELYAGDPRRARDLYETLRSYWTERDREHYERLVSGGSTIAYLRRRG